MLSVASDDHRRHHPREPFHDAGRMVPPPEVPERAERIRAALEAADLGEIRAPTAHGLEPVLAVHADDYVEFLRTIHDDWRVACGVGEDGEAVAYARALRGSPPVPLVHPVARLGWYSHDSDPVLAGTWAAASAAVDVALTARDAIVAGEPGAYALCRPPGHHAGVDSFAGYCYLDNAAIAAQAWTAEGARVAVLDVDYHHGNGTQQIFYDRADVLVVSLHADPAAEYPYLLGFAGETGAGPGEGCTANYPLPLGTAWAGYAPALADAVRRVRDFAPDVLVVSLGVDTAIEDPDSFRLVAGDYPRLGGAVAGLGLPTLFVQEGGYDLDALGRNVVGVLRGFADG